MILHFLKIYINCRFVCFSIIRPGIICAVLQSAAQYTWYTFNETPIVTHTSLNGWNSKFEPYWILKLIAIGLLLLITAYHIFSNKWAVGINHTLAIIKMIIIFVIALGGISRYHDADNWKKSLDSPESSNLLSPYSVAIIEIFFSYNGWNTLNYSLDEFKDPERKLKSSNIYSIGIVTLLCKSCKVLIILIILFFIQRIIFNQPFYHRFIGKCFIYYYRACRVHNRH